MRFIRFAPLEIDSSKVRVEWTVDPPSEIYRETAFELNYGSELDPRELPLDFWWTLIPLILHSHWNLLRPCKVILPVRLNEREIEFWLRFLDQERVSLEMYRQGDDFSRTIEIVCEGPRPASGKLPSAGDRWATAFSGGKDSLTQAALLGELTQRPLLVNTCDPMPPLIDHEWPFRQRALDEIARRRDVEVVVVNSTLRRTWPHYEIPHQLGYPISIALMGDPHLMVANTLAVAAGRGIRHVTLAAELELARVDEYQGRPAFAASIFAYGFPFIFTIDRLMQRFGMRVSTLLAPFSHVQIQTLLRKRYADIADLQISCFWMTENNERSCSQCLKCRRTAMILLAIGEDPASLGIDLRKLFVSGPGFELKKSYPGTGRTLAHCATAMDTAAVRKYFRRQGFMERLGLRQPAAFVELNKVINRIGPVARPHVDSTHDLYFRYLEESIRESIMRISLEHFPVRDTTENVPDDANINSVVNWICAPLSSEG